VYTEKKAGIQLEENMQNRKRAPQGMYTAQEAISVIDIPPTSFYTLVNSGDIQKIVPPGRKEGFYSKTEIDRYARSLKLFSQPYQDEKLDFGLALTEDLPHIHELTASVSGGYAHAVPVEILKAWIRKNPQSIHILRKGNEVVGYISTLPLSIDTIVLRMQGKLLNREIPIDDIQPFEPNTHIMLYIAEMAVKHDPNHIKNNEPDMDNPDPQARRRGARLIREASRFVVDLKRQGTTISKIYAVGTTPFGIEMCKDLGMKTMVLPTGVREDRAPCELDTTDGTESILVRKLFLENKQVA
jgi:hypothetical protein